MSESTPEAAPTAASIRPAGVADADVVAPLVREIFVETFGPSNKPENIDGYVRQAFAVERVRQELANPATIALIAEVDGEPAGFARMEAGEAPDGIGGDAAIELVRLYVRSAFHGAGLAATLMQACIDAAKARGCDVMWLGVWEHNPRAQAFYRKWGFERAGEHVFLLGDEEQTDYLLRRPL